jgi:hypothetical protein
MVDSRVSYKNGGAICHHYDCCSYFVKWSARLCNIVAPRPVTLVCERNHGMKMVLLIWLSGIQSELASYLRAYDRPLSLCMNKYSVSQNPILLGHEASLLSNFINSSLSNSALFSSSTSGRPRLSCIIQSNPRSAGVLFIGMKRGYKVLLLNRTGV